MTSPKKFLQALSNKGVSFFTGVPDSLLKEFCAHLDFKLEISSHIIAANEGSAIGIAAGYHLATNKIPLVYLQNSGIGNAVNPLLSLADKEVYSIPMILLIGWRGEPGIKDEPQHLKQGRISKELLNTMEIPFKIISNESDKSIANVEWAYEKAKKQKCPIALLVKKGSFEKNEENNSVRFNNWPLSREDAISIIAKYAPKNIPFVSTTGMISRELYEQRSILNQDRKNDFLTVGSMGHASQIALGIALANSSKQVVCLDGDGSVLMHMGGMPIIGTSKNINLIHIVLNNSAHDSVGGQPTVADKISLTKIAEASCYEKVIGPIKNENELISILNSIKNFRGKIFIEVYVRKGARSNLGRPKESPLINKEIFVSNLRN